MKKIFITLTIIILAVLAIFLALPGLAGMMIKDQFNQELKQLQTYYPKNNIKAKLTKNGWFSSRVVYSFVKHKDKVHGVLNFEHGPIVISKHGLTFGLARITKSHSSSTFYGKTAFTGSVAFSGDFHLKGHVVSFTPALRHLGKKSQDTKDVSAGGGIVELSTFDDLNGFTLKSIIHDFKVNVPKDKTGPKIEMTIPTLTQVYKVTDINTSNYKFIQSGMAQNTTIKSGKVTVKVNRFGLNNMHLSRKALNDFVILTKQAEMTKILTQDKNATKAEEAARAKKQNRFFKKAMMLFAGVAGNDTSFNITGGTFHTPYAKGKFGLHVGFYGIDAKHPLNSKTLINHLKYTLFVKSPKIFVPQGKGDDTSVLIKDFMVRMNQHRGKVFIGMFKMMQGPKATPFEAKNLVLSVNESGDLSDLSFNYHISEKSICAMGQCFTNGEFNFGVTHLNYQSMLNQNLRTFKPLMIQPLLHKMVKKDTRITSNLKVHAPLGEVKYNLVGTFPNINAKTSLQKALALKLSVQVPDKYVAMFLGPFMNKAPQTAVSKYTVSTSPILPERLDVMRRSWMQLGYLTRKNGNYHLSFAMEPDYQFSMGGKPVPELVQAAALINVGSYGLAEMILKQPKYANNPDAQRMIQAIVAKNQSNSSEASSSMKMPTPQPMIFRK